jgi:rubrerythrin
MKKPTPEQIDFAITWLELNEGADGEGEGCKAVADWLAHMQREDYLRSEARKAGEPVARLRRKLKEQADTATCGFCCSYLNDNGVCPSCG